MTKFNVKYVNSSESFDVRQIRQQIAQIQEAQSLRKERLNSSSKMNSYAKSKGISVSEMTKLIKQNFSDNQKNLKALNNIVNTDAFKKAESDFKKKTSRIKFKSISGKGGGGGGLKMPQEYAKKTLFRKN
jgi:DNA-binding PucR family transcriptional regulator